MGSRASHPNVIRRRRNGSATTSRREDMVVVSAGPIGASRLPSSAILAMGSRRRRYPRTIGGMAVRNRRPPNPLERRKFESPLMNSSRGPKYCG
jgi:hypothetical protein